MSWRSNCRAIQWSTKFSFLRSGLRSQSTELLPFYVRGEAYLRLGRGQEAAAEFQRILVHRGSGRLSMIDALARLQLGRARTLLGDAAGARTAYQDFFALWKDADPDIPILKQAKAEYVKLQ